MKTNKTNVATKNIEKYEIHKKEENKTGNTYAKPTE